MSVYERERMCVRDRDREDGAVVVPKNRKEPGKESGK